MGPVERAGNQKRLERRRNGGFTLVELLVVIAIIGLAASVVVVAMPDAAGGPGREAERFAARAKAARDSALLESRPTSIQLVAGGYEVATRAEGAWRTAAQYEWVEGTEAAAAGEGRSIFDPTGLAGPLHLTLRRGGEKAEIEIAHDGRIQIRR